MIDRRSALAALAIALISAQSSGQESDLADQVAGLAQPLVDAGIATGLVIGTLAGDEAEVVGLGRVRRGGSERPNGDTVYEIGSITKVFTGLLLAEAAERGAVALEDAAQQHAPRGMRIPAFGPREIRLVHLATHTSGLPRLPANVRPRDPLDPYADYDGRRLARFLARYELTRPPGESAEYSNLAVGLLGELVAYVDGADFESALVKRVTGPLGLDDTRIALSNDRLARLAPGYDVDGRRLENWDLNVLAGASGLRSTVNDLLSFARANLHPEASPLADAIRLSHEVQFDFDDACNGLALCWKQGDGGTTLSHSGAIGGYRSFLGLHPPTGRAIVVLSNTSSPKIDELANQLLKMLAGEPAKPVAIRHPRAVDRASLERCTGAYRSKRVRRVEVSLERDGLFARFGRTPPVRLYAESETHFFCRAVDVELNFELSVTGEVSAVIVTREGRQERAERVES